jgi:hypothetical protein
MNNIGRPGGPPPGTGFLTQDAFAGPGGDLGDRRSLHADLLEGEPLEFEEESTGSSQTATEREADFLRSFRAAVRGSRRDAEGEGQGAQQEEMPEPRVLAVAEQQLWTGLPSPADTAPAAEKKSPSTESMVASVMESIDRSIRAEMAPRAGAPLNLKIAFHDESLGLTGLRITVTPTTLDVVFERTGSVVAEEFVRAAEALAQRLMTRFSKRTVRILDLTASDREADQEDPAAVINAPLKLFT